MGKMLTENLKPLTVADVFAALDDLAPTELAAKWDNPGLLVGDMASEVRGVMFALDLSRGVIEQAKAAACNLIVTHHPFIFQPQPHIIAGTYEGDLVVALVKNDMACIACHTNWDNAAGGINWVLAEALGLQNVAPLLDPADGAEILLPAGEFARDLSADELLQTVAGALGLPCVRAAGLAADKQYRKIAVCGGAAMDFWRDAYACGCDALVSADPKHHEGLQAAHAGFAVIDGTHFATEVIGIRRLGKMLGDALPDLLICTAAEQDSWQFYGAGGGKL